MSETSAQPQTPARRKKRHWVLWSLLVILLLVGLIVLAVQIVFWTGIPRSLVLNQVQSSFGLRMGAKSVQTGWLGNTVLHDVDLGLPLSNKAFLKVPVMKVHTNSPLGMATGSGVNIKGIELDDPTLYVWQDETGRWNLQEVAELLQRALGKRPAEEKSKSSSSPEMPNVKIVDGTVVVTDNKRRTTTIQPIELDGYPETPVSWAYDLRIQPDSTAPPRVGLKGRVVPGGLFQHEADLVVQNIGDWIKPWNPNPPGVYVDVNWRGQVTNGGVEGRLESRKIQIDQNEVYGVMNVATGGGGFRLTPDNLLVKNAQHIVPDVKLASGSMLYTGSDVQLQKLLVTLFGGPVRLDGSYNIKARTGRLGAQWNQLVLGKSVKNSGELNVSVVWPLPNLLQVQGNLVTHGTAVSGPWQAHASFGASGPGWTDFNWNIDAPNFEWRRSIPIVLNGMKFTGGLHPKNVNGTTARVLSLDSASLPQPGRLSGNAWYVFDKSQSWAAHFQGENWYLRALKDTPVSFTLDARGDHALAHLDTLNIKGADTTVTLAGTYTYGIPKPVDGTLTLTNTAPTANPLAEANPNTGLLRGTVNGGVKMNGTLVPLELGLTGSLTGREVDILQHHIGEMALKLTGNVNADRADVRTDHLSLLGGQWNLEGIYDLDTDAIDVTVGVQDLSLEQTAAVADQQNVAGALTGQWDIYVPALQFNANAIRVTGGATMRNVAAMDLPLADEVTFKTTLDGGQFLANPIEMRRGQGRAQMRLSMDVNNPRSIDAGVLLSNWPLDLNAARLHADTWINAPDVRIDLPNGKSRDPSERKLRLYGRQIDIRSIATLEGKSLASLEVYAGVWRRTLDLRSIHATLLGGRADGQARLDLEHFTKSTGELTWVDLDTKLLSTFYPELKDFSGTLTGNARLAPAEVYRPLEPLAVVIKNNFANGYWRTIPVQDATIIGYIGEDVDDPAGGYRFVLGSGPAQTSTIHVDDGIVRLWGRVSRHARETLAVQAQLGLEGLSLDRFVHAFDATANPMPGRIGGTLTLLYATRPVVPRVAMYAFPAQAPTIVPASQPATAPTTMSTTRRSGPLPEVTTAPVAQPPPLAPLQGLFLHTYADGELKLTHASLLGYGPIAGLYSLMNAGPGMNTPSGTGDIKLHLEQGTLRIDYLRYFNRGTEIRGAGTVQRIWDLPDSPIQATAVGTLQPLRQRKFPLLADINAVLAVIQQNVTTIKIWGMVRKPQWAPILFGDIGGELQRFIAGDVSSEIGETGSR